MKALRWFTIVLLVILVVSTWAPAPVYAKSSGSASTSISSLVSDLTKATVKLAKVRIRNQTGGALTARFSGPYSYSFSTSAKSWTSDAVIQPGKYVITITSSACGGSFTLRKNVKGGTVGLPTMVCSRKKK
jgi:hypothetical protein